jgi:hypothetical protein
MYLGEHQNTIKKVAFQVADVGERCSLKNEISPVSLPCKEGTNCEYMGEL